MAAKNSGTKKKQAPSTEKKDVKVQTTIDKKLIFRLCLLIGVFSFLLYVNTLHHGFVLDDASVIKENNLTKGGTAALKDIFKSAYRAGYVDGEKNLYRPLSKAMFAVEWQLSPNNPTIHHFMNILLYALCCVLLFLVLKRLTNLNIYLLLLVTLLFAAHPIHTEVVANIKSRDEILTMFFLLLSLQFALKYLNGKKILNFIAFVVCFFLGMLSKESAIVFVAIVPLSIYFFTDTPLKENLKLTLSLVVVSIIYLCIHKAVIGGIALTNVPVIDNTLLVTNNFMQQRMTSILILGKYLLLLFIPSPLSCDYSFNTIPIVTSFANAGFLLALIVHVALLIFAIKKWKEKSVLAYSIFFYFISMSIASNIFILIGTHMAERLLFFPSIAFCLGLVYGFDKLLKLNVSIADSYKTFMAAGKPLLMVCVVVLFLFSIKTVARNKDWKSNGTLFEKDVQTVPNSAHMLMYYADYLSNKDSLAAMSPAAKEVRLAKAQKSILKALNIYELFPDAHYLSGRIYYEYKNFEASYKEYNRALTLNPGQSMYHNNAGTSLFALGRYPEAIKEFAKAEELNPTEADHPFNLGSAYGAMGESLRSKNDMVNATAMFNKAIEKFKRAIELNPNYKSAYQFMGFTYRSLGDTVNANAYLQKAEQTVMKRND